MVVHFFELTCVTRGTHIPFAHKEGSRTHSIDRTCVSRDVPHPISSTTLWRTYDIHVSANHHLTVPQPSRRLHELRTSIYTYAQGQLINQKLRSDHPLTEQSCITAQKEKTSYPGSVFTTDFEFKLSLNSCN